MGVFAGKPVKVSVTKMYLYRAILDWYHENNYFTEMCSGSKEGSYLRLIDLCITQL